MHVLNVIIGLIFIFLIYSLLATALQESIATIIQRRANTLYHGIQSMLSNTRERHLPWWLKIIYFSQLWRFAKFIGFKKAQRKEIQSAVKDLLHAKPDQKFNRNLYRLVRKDVALANQQTSSICLYQGFMIIR